VTAAIGRRRRRRRRRRRKGKTILRVNERGKKINRTEMEKGAYKDPFHTK
jgi:hypothetical protein